jgi:putative ABC transport system ATP-binding protein
MTQPTVELVDVSRVYRTRGGPVNALDHVTVAFAPASFTAVMGPSGSGKTTLLQCAAGLDRPTSGDVRWCGEDVRTWSDRRLTMARRDRVGFVFQAFNLLPTLTAEQNVTLPMRLAHRRVARSRVRAALDQVGLSGLGRRHPAELSGGQQQRVAIARALIAEPLVVFADEPTGALDSTTGHQILRLVRDLVAAHGRTVVMVTHDPVAASYAQRVVFLADGRLAGELADPTPHAVAEHLTGLTRA